MSATVLGSQIFELPSTSGFDRSSGFYTERHWMGTVPFITDLYNQEKSLADSISTKDHPDGGGLMLLDARYTLDTTSTLTLDTEETHLSLFIHPRYVILGEAEQTQVRNLVSDNQSSFGVKLETLKRNVTNPEQQALAVELLKIMTAGQTTYPYVAWVLTLSITAWSGSSTMLNTASTNVIWSPLAIVNYLNGFTALNTIAFSVPEDTLTPTEIGLGYVWGWRKATTRVSVTASGKAQLQEQWKSGKYNTNIFNTLG